MRTIDAGVRIVTHVSNIFEDKKTLFSWGQCLRSCVKCQQITRDEGLLRHVVQSDAGVVELWVGVDDDARCGCVDGDVYAYRCFKLEW